MGTEWGHVVRDQHRRTARPKLDVDNALTLSRGPRLRDGQDEAVIREDRELLAELARLNRAMASLALRIMDGSTSAGEQRDYAERLIAAGERLRCRADETNHPVIDGEVTGSGTPVFPEQTAEPW
jgi:hypothetical protein